jgi:hypothetical protein
VDDRQRVVHVETRRAARTVTAGAAAAAEPVPVRPPRITDAPLLAAIAIAGLATATTIDRSVFAAVAADTSGYVAAAEALHDGRLARPAPLQLVPAVRDSGAILAPLGFRPGLEPGTTVPIYPLGLPALMAAVRPVGEEAVYLVSPLALGVLVLCAFRLARDMGGAAAGLGAALFTALNPATILNAVLAMSDVPAAAGWIGAWYFARRATWSGALTAGALAALATTIRPNLAPLAAVPALVCLFARSDPDGARRPLNWRALGTFAVAAAAGPVLVAWSQAVLYGGPFVSGYPEASSFFRLAHAWLNLRTYPALFATTFGWAPVTLGVVAAGAWFFAGSSARAGAIAAAGILLLNVLVYTWYLPYDHWPFLRFFLPGTTALAVASCGLIGDAIRRRVRSPARGVAAALIPATALASGWHAAPRRAEAFTDAAVQHRARTAGRYLREALPGNAVVIAYIHGGAAAHYTGRPVLGPANLAAPALDALVGDLQRHGFRPMLLIDDQLEGSQFRALFATSTYGALDWPPRAEFHTAGTIRYFEFADRARHLAGERWPIDVLR